MSYSFYNRGWHNRQYQPRPNNRYSQQQARNYSFKKHSGCKVKKDHVSKEGVSHAIVVHGWKYTKKQGLQSFVACEAKGKYQTGKLRDKYITMVVTWTSPTGKSTLWAQWNREKQILWIPDLNIVASGNQDYVKYIMPKTFKNRR